MTTMLKVWHSSTSKKDIHANNANYSTTYATTTNRWGQTVSRGEEEKLHVGNSTFKILKKLKNLVNLVKLCTIVVVIIVKMIFMSSFFFYCLLCNHSFQTNPNSTTNLCKLFNYICSMRSSFLLYRLH